MNEETSLSLSQMMGAWRMMCSASPNAAFATLPGAECLFAGIPIPFFNVGVLTGDVETGDSLLGRSRDVFSWAESYRVPWFLMVTHEALAPGLDPAPVLEQLGLVPLLDLTGMIANEVSPPDSLPEHLMLSVPDTDEDCAAMLSINEAAYGMDMQPAQPVLGTREFWKNHIPVVASVEGEPVSCSAVMPVDGFHYVAFVATLPDYRRRGYADAAMRHSLAVAAKTHGNAKTFLHATDAGRPVYERMGYRTVSSHSLFIQGAFLH